jgi:iron complex outermembrane receptor protein
MLKGFLLSTDLSLKKNQFRRSISRPRIDHKLAVSTLVLLLILSTPVWAAEAANSGETVQLSDIVVGATKMNTELKKIPTNISVIFSEQIEKYPSNYSVFDILREANIPGVYMPFSAYGIDEDGLVSTRGGEVSAWGMKVLINGIEFNKGNGYIVPPRIALHDIERIEITKTPSAEYGDQAIGGVINIITRTAEKPVEAKVGAAYGGFGGGNGYGVINGSDGNWEYYLDASVKREDGYQDRTYMHDNNVYTKINYKFKNDAHLAFHGSYFDTVANYANGLTRAQFEQDPTQNPGPDYELHEKEKLAALDYGQMFGPHELKIKLEVKDELTNMFWYSYYIFDELEVHPEASFTLNNTFGEMDNKIVIGGEYRYHTIDTQINQATSITNIGALIGVREREDTTWSFYLQDELDVTHALTVTAGIRYDQYDQEQIGKNDPANTWSQDNDAVSPKLGLTYQLNDKVNLFGGFNSGFKSPARVAAAATSGSLNPEFIYAYEGGARGQLTKWLDYNVALFRNEVKDKFVKPSTAPNAKYENAGETLSQGVEMGLNAKFQNGFYSSVSFTYQEAKFIDFTSSGVKYDNNYLNNVPEYMSSISFGYQHKVLGDISLNPVYTGERYFNYCRWS